MGLGQTMISAAFFSLVMLSVISVNRMMIESAVLSYETQAFDEAVMLAQDLLIETRTKRFDEKVSVSTTNVWSALSFTTEDKLGPDGGAERDGIRPFPDLKPFKSTATTFYDDFDDYDGYQRRVASIQLTDSFTVWSNVFYTTFSNTESNSSGRTFFKRIDVYVSHSRYLKDTLRFSRVMTF
ncbi:MAG: hypothetical protein V1799_14755 [bacterium]